MWPRAIPSGNKRGAGKSSSETSNPQLLAANWFRRKKITLPGHGQGAQYTETVVGYPIIFSPIDLPWVNSSR